MDGYEVLLCVTGGIACYKSAALTSKLIQAGAGVTVAMTESASRFVAPLTFQTLSGRAVYSSMWQAVEDYRPGHLSLTEAADLMIVAPATANILAKMAAGIADELVSALALSAHGACDILLAPAMNTRMWEAPATQANLATLAERGVHTVGPTEGYLACGAVGKGRMAEPAEILAAAGRLLTRREPKRRR
ncbi:MAG: phosphopantothenoylcysteine decarboxylase [Planctomycetales bacterium 4484_123]|nr:MAG: phosphopantothenoylcysteine decarboxylase [Planctomycetales bacterium 4484_123]